MVVVAGGGGDPAGMAISGSRGRRDADRLPRRGSEEDGGVEV
jgi:hypothetical protein